jgi:hypothetical protein
MQTLDPDVEAGLFLNALEHAGKAPLDAVQVAVLEVNQSSAPEAVHCGVGQGRPRGHPPGLGEASGDLRHHVSATMKHNVSDLGELEREVLHLVWDHGPSTADWVQKALSR